MVTVNPADPSKASRRTTMFDHRIVLRVDMVDMVDIRRGINMDRPSILYFER